MRVGALRQLPRRRVRPAPTSHARTLGDHNRNMPVSGRVRLRESRCTATTRRPSVSGCGHRRERRPREGAPRHRARLGRCPTVSCCCPGSRAAIIGCWFFPSEQTVERWPCHLRRREPESIAGNRPCGMGVRHRRTTSTPSTRQGDARPAAGVVAIGFARHRRVHFKRPSRNEPAVRAGHGIRSPAEPLADRKVSRGSAPRR